MEKKNFRILIVDDERPIRELIFHILIEHGYSLWEADNGKSALEVFRDQRPDLVITDVYMPKMDGVELLYQIKKEAPETFVNVMTGYGSEELAIEAIRNGASNYFKKPLNPFELTHAVDVLYNLVSSRKGPVFDRKNVLSESMSIELKNDLNLAYTLIYTLTETPALFYSDIKSIRIGLLEAITNAIEHGCLGITYEEKQAAIRTQSLGKLYAQRSEMFPYQDRKVFVEYEFSRSKLIYTIRDGGEGFDWQNLPDSEDPNNIMGVGGRGIYIMRLCMDEVVFNEKGNAVTLMKFI